MPLAVVQAGAGPVEDIEVVHRHGGARAGGLSPSATQRRGGAVPPLLSVATSGFWPRPFRSRSRSRRYVRVRPRPKMAAAAASRPGGGGAGGRCGGGASGRGHGEPGSPIPGAVAGPPPRAQDPGGDMEPTLPPSPRPLTLDPDPDLAALAEELDRSLSAGLGGSARLQVRGGRAEGAGVSGQGSRSLCPQDTPRGSHHAEEMEGVRRCLRSLLPDPGGECGAGGHRFLVPPPLPRL